MVIWIHYVHICKYRFTTLLKVGWAIYFRIVFVSDSLSNRYISSEWSDWMATRLSTYLPGTHFAHALIVLIAHDWRISELADSHDY